MKAIILTLAVAGFMSSAHAGVYKKTSDRQMLNKSSVDCIDKSSNGLNDDTNPNRTVYHNNNTNSTKAQKGITSKRYY